jgi:hypothetical protein
VFIIARFWRRLAGILGSRRRAGPGVAERTAYSVLAVGPPHPEYPGEYLWGVKLDGADRLAEALAVCGLSAERDLTRRCGGDRPAAVVVVRADGSVVCSTPLAAAAA